MSENTTNNQERPILEVLQDIKAGRIDPRLLDQDARRQCVEVLMCEGYKQVEIAPILKCSDKTIYFDKKANCKKNSIKANPDFKAEMVGELVSKAGIHELYLMRFARNTNVPDGVRVQATYFSWRIRVELCEKLRLLGFLSKTQLFDNTHAEKIKDAMVGKSKKERELIMQYSCLPPMGMERLVEKLRQEIVKLDEDIRKEEEEEKEPQG